MLVNFLRLNLLLKNQLHITPLSNKTEAPFELLELADPSRKLIELYLKEGMCYIATLNEITVGVIVLSKINTTTIEIKNIAVKESEQRKGFGKILLKYAEDTSRNLGYTNLLIGTGNSSIKPLTFYQKEGFEIEKIEKNFFIKNYSEAIFENGIQCKHLILLRKKI